MRSTFKNLALILSGTLLGAATIVGYTESQSGATHSIASSAQTATAQSTPSGAAEDTIAEIYQRLSPAVVNVTNRRLPEIDDPLNQFPERGVGSGVIIDEEGHILTNNHVVDQADQLEVTLIDGTRVPASLTGRDPGDDLAVIQIQMNDSIRSKIAVAAMGDSDRLKPGQLAIAIGNPFGLQGSVTSGIISSIGRTFPTETGRLVRNMIQTDAAINPGNSGGPLINSNGEVVGINTAIESPVRGFVGIGLAVPVNVARNYLPAMLAGETVAHPWLGISGTTITEEIAQLAGLSATSGVYVIHVLPSSPAEKAALQGAVSTAGIQISPSDRMPTGGDVVTSVDSQPVSSIEELIAYVDSKEIGDRITLTVLRDGTQQNVTVTLEKWPDESRP